MAAGKLTLGLNAQSPVLSGGGADIQNTASTISTLVLDFTGGADPTATVRDDLLSGLIHDSTSTTPIPGDGLVTLGYFESGSLLTIEPVLAGDANGDGQVDGADFAALRSNWGATGDATWATGDFNYDGAVNGADFTLLLANWGKTWLPGETAGIMAGASLGLVSAGQSAPEPSTIVLLGIGAVSLLAYGWRRRRRAA